MGKEENSWRFPVARALEEQALEASTGMGAMGKKSDSNVDYLLGMLNRKYFIKALGTVRSARAGGEGGTVKKINTFGQPRHMLKTTLEETLSLLQKNRTSLTPFPAQIDLDLSRPLWSAATQREA